MSLWTRWKTLLRADAHGVVDALGDKALILRQHLRDATVELDRKRSRLETLAVEDEDLRREKERMTERLESADQDVTLALEQGEEELARYAIQRLLPLREGYAELARRREAVREETEALSARLAEQEIEYEHLERRVRVHLDRLEYEKQGEVRASAWAERSCWAGDVTDEDVELELLRRRAESPGGE